MSVTSLTTTTTTIHHHRLPPSLVIGENKNMPAAA
jgi:hypothetical protein